MKKNTTSLKVFRKYLLRNNSSSIIDASKIHSRECYCEWLRTKKCPESDDQAKKFYRALSNHISGVDGRCPFFPEEEAAILSVLRMKQKWPCFPHHFTLGQSGYRSQGFHEKEALHSPNKHCIMVKRPKLAVVEEELSPEDQAYVNHMLQQVLEFVASFPFFRFEVWKTIYSIVRMVMLTRSPRATHVFGTISNEYVQELCRTESLKKGPDYFVMIYDTLASEYKNRILAQNALAKHFFGDLVGNFSVMLVDPSETERVVLANLYVVHKPGVDYHLPQLKMKTKTGQVELFDASFCIDAKTSILMMVCGKRHFVTRGPNIKH